MGRCLRAVVVFGSFMYVAIPSVGLRSNNYTARATVDKRYLVLSLLVNNPKVSLLVGELRSNMLLRISLVSQLSGNRKAPAQYYPQLASQPFVSV